MMRFESETRLTMKRIVTKDKGWFQERGSRTIKTWRGGGMEEVVTAKVVFDSHSYQLCDGSLLENLFIASVSLVSHDGSCHFIAPSNPRAPSLYALAVHKAKQTGRDKDSRP